MRGNAFSAVVDPKEPTTYTNPVIPGFFSDPSVCRVGNDYYLVNSTFEYFPGVPVFHSKDLVNWELIGYALHRPDQLKKAGNVLQPNIFATTIRHHDGVFYMITTNTGGGGNFYVTATNPAGPWSEPVWIDAPGIDPDLFFDDDGKVYVISSTFELHQIDVKTGKFLSEGRRLWNGTGGRYAEGPHIYKKDGFYYLMVAEGGTEEAHSETIARSKDIWGPYNSNPANPILAHANAAGQGNPIQGVGHADIVNAHDGSYDRLPRLPDHRRRRAAHPRPRDVSRTRFVAEARMARRQRQRDGDDEMKVPTLPLKPFAAKPARLEFDAEALGLEWNHIRNPVVGSYSLAARKGYLRLTGTEQTIEDRKSPTFVGRRVQDMNFTATTQVEFEPTPKTSEEAGLILLNNGCALRRGDQAVGQGASGGREASLRRPRPRFEGSRAQARARAARRQGRALHFFVPVRPGHRRADRTRQGGREVPQLRDGGRLHRRLRRALCDGQRQAFDRECGFRLVRGTGGTRPLRRAEGDSDAAGARGSAQGGGSCSRRTPYSSAASTTSTTAGRRLGSRCDSDSTYYRGIWLSMSTGFEVTVDGEKFSKEQVEVTVGGRTYTQAEMTRIGSVQWPNYEAAILTVAKPGGLEPGVHDVAVAWGHRTSYIPGGISMGRPSPARKLVLVY